MPRFKKVFEVWNDTDGIPAAPEAFASFDAAYDFTVQFRQRFRGQSFYKTSAGERISPMSVELRIEEVDGARVLHPLGPESVVAFLVDGEGPHSLEDMVSSNPEEAAWFKKAAPGEGYRHLSPHREPIEIQAIIAQ
jgi:hypothetical protein